MSAIEEYRAANGARTMATERWEQYAANEVGGDMSATKRMKPLGPRLWWASTTGGFVQPGLHVYLFGRHWWIFRLRIKNDGD